jgi:hypothetical protein
MAATFTYSVANLERNLSDGGVTRVHFKVEGVDGEHSMGASGTMDYEPDASADGFTAFDNLTESQVIGWVQASLGGAEKVAEIEAQIQAKIDEKANPVTAVGMPWS